VGYPYPATRNPASTPPSNSSGRTISAMKRNAHFRAGLNGNGTGRDTALRLAGRPGLDFFERCFIIDLQNDHPQRP
jgi:hypothetical protein